MNFFQKEGAILKYIDQYFCNVVIKSTKKTILDQTKKKMPTFLALYFKWKGTHKYFELRQAFHAYSKFRDLIIDTTQLTGSSAKNMMFRFVIVVDFLYKICFLQICLNLTKLQDVRMFHFGEDLVVYWLLLFSFPFQTSLKSCRIWMGTETKNINLKIKTFSSNCSLNEQLSR